MIPLWHVSFRSGVETLRIAMHFLLTYLSAAIRERYFTAVQQYYNSETGSSPLKGCAGNQSLAESNGSLPPGL